MKEVRNKDLNAVRFMREHFSFAANKLVGLNLPWWQRHWLDGVNGASISYLLACRGSGKCVTGDTLIPSENGFMYIDEFLSVDKRVERYFDYNCNILTPNGIKQTSHFYVGGLSDTIKVKTEDGFKIQGTPEHKVLCVSKDGLIGMKMLSEIDINDFILMKCNDYIFGEDVNLLQEPTVTARYNKKCKLPNKMTPDLAYFIGVLIGDGCLKGQSSRVAFTNIDNHIISKMNKITKDIFDLEWAQIDEQNYRIDCIWLKNWLYSVIGMDLVKSVDKTIPITIRKSSKEVIISFLTGLFDTDGTVTKGGTAQFCTSSKKLANEVHYLLLSLGIVSSLNSKKTKCNDAYSITILSGFIQQFLDIFTDIMPIKKERIFIKNNSNPNRCGIPIASLHRIQKNINENGLNREVFDNKHKANINNAISINNALHDDNLNLIIEYYSQGYYFSRVIELSYDEDYVYDFTVPDGHLFIANGMVNHNTFFQSMFCLLRATLFPKERVGIVSNSYRQAQMVFTEVVKLIEMSPHIKQCIVSGPTFGINKCYVKFANGSSIDALPLGDGGKIRSARFHTLVVDEFQDIDQSIVDSVILPFLNVQKNPVTGMLLEETPKSYKNANKNRLIITSTARYKHDDVYDKYAYIKKKFDDGDPNYFHSLITLDDLRTVQGWVNEEIIEMQQNTMSKTIFLMENYGVWAESGTGFFDALACSRMKSLHCNFLDAPRPGCYYVLGVDPAKSSANFTIVGLEWCPADEMTNLFFIEAYNADTVDSAVGTIKYLQNKFDAYVYMDARGGGIWVADRLMETELTSTRGDVALVNGIPMEKLVLVQTAHPLIDNMNWALKASIENSKLRVPAVADSEFVDNAALALNDKHTNEINELIKECQSIILKRLEKEVQYSTENKNELKDRYCALLYANWGIIECFINQTDEDDFFVVSVH